MRNCKKKFSRNVLMRDGSVRRVPKEVAEHLLKAGQAQYYISNTVFRAMALGIVVEDPTTRDEDGFLFDQIQIARERVARRRRKEDARRIQEELDLFDNGAA